MIPERSNIVIIGMAGCGKTSIGKLLARKLNRPFLDTDDLMVERQQLPLQQIIDTEGTESFRQIEEKVLLNINVRDHVIATGGSSIYSESGMKHLKKSGIVVLLKLPVTVLKERVGDAATRGLVRQPKQSFEDLFAERKKLYERHAEITVDCVHLGQEGVCDKITGKLQQSGAGKAIP